MRIRFRTVFWSAASALLAALLIYAFLPEPVDVAVGTVRREALRVTVRDEGRTRVREEYVVSAPLAGQLLRVGLKPGAQVRAGDTVARILPGKPAFLDSRALAEAQAGVRQSEAALSAARAEFERAAEQYNFARIEAERITSLRERGLVSAGEYDRAELTLRTGQASRDAAAKNVEQRYAELDASVARLTQPGGRSDPDAVVDVLAPASGRVLRVVQESESVIAAGGEILSIGDPSDLEVVVELLSTDAVQVEQGAAVILEDWGRNGLRLDGRVRLVEPGAFRKVSALGVEEQRVNVIVDFTGPASEWSTLGHGYRVEAAIVTWEAADVLTVPVAALFRSGDAWAVFRIAEGRARLTRVHIGHRHCRAAEVLGGLELNEQVILYPAERIADGVTVKPRGAATRSN